VTITLEVVQQSQSGAQDSTFALRRVLQAWGEGSQIPADPQSPGLGAPAATGEASWNHRFAPGTAWFAPGGRSGVDFAANPSSLAPIVAVGDQLVFASTPALVADVQAWLDQPASNLGWIMLTEAETIGRTARGFASRESGFGPTLTIDFAAVPEPSTIRLLGLAFVALAWRVRRCH
jgi:hypothetical protein